MPERRSVREWFRSRRGPARAVEPEADAQTRPSTRHAAHVDLRSNGEYFFTTYSHDHYLGVLDGPAIVLAPDANTEEVGAATLAALMRSTTIVAPDDLRQPLPATVALIARAGAKTYTGYMRDTKSIGVFAEFAGDSPDEIELTPQQKSGGRGGREPLMDKRVTVTYSTSEALGVSVLAALGDATT